MEAEKENPKIVSFFKLFSFADSKDIVLMIVGTIAAFGSGAIFPFLTLFMGQLVQSFGTHPNGKILVPIVSKISIKLLYFACVAAVFGFLQVACWMVTGERQATRIRSLYLKNILRQDVSFFDTQTNSGEIIGRMSGDTALIQNAMGEKVGLFMQLMAQFFCGFMVAFCRGWMLTCLLLVSIPILLVAIVAMSSVLSRLSHRGQNAYAEAATVVEQTIGSIRTVASFTGENRAIHAYNKHLQTAYSSSVLKAIVDGLGAGVTWLVIFSLYGMGVWYGAKLILEKGYTGGQVINVIVAILMSSMAMGQAFPCLGAFAAGQAAAHKMFETIQRKPEIDAYETEGRVLDEIQGDIELRNVYFSYPARPDEKIFSGFCLSIPSGETTALVGQSGSGKSTVISLIERFYEPEFGEVLIDGINLKEFQLKWIRNKIGLVSQEPVLFTSSIMENIAYGKNDATLKEIRAAAELANAAKFIDKLPQGLGTMVGERGTQLSGGQKQRIAIARAILKNPRILLLDEATSALDAESERVVQEALDRAMVNRTTVVVAHRLATVRNANLIVVIHRGKIVEEGTHSNLLMDPDGAYSQLIRLQGASKESEQDTGGGIPSEISMESFEQLSERRPLRRSISKTLSKNNIGYYNSPSLKSESPTRLDRVDNDLKTRALLKEKISEVSIWRLAALNKQEIPVLIAGTIVACVGGTIMPIYGFLISRAIKTFYEPPHQLREDSKFWALMFVTLGLASFVMNPLKTYCFSIAGSKLIQRIRSFCFKKVVHMEMGWFDEPDHSSGAIGARLSADAADINALVGDSLSLIVQNIATAVAALVLAFTACWQLTLIIMCIIPLMALNGPVQSRFMKGLSTDAKMMYEEASQITNDAIGNIRTVASFCAEETMMELYEKKCEGPKKAGVRLGLTSGVGFGISLSSMFLAYAASFYFGALLVEAGYTTFPNVFQVFLALSLATTGIAQNSSMASVTTKAKVAANSVFSIINRKSMIDPSDETGTILENVRGEIEFHNITFRYPTRPNIQIFCDLSLTIPPEKTIALVGESGSGKSTAIALLQRFYDPDSGHITLDGVEIQSLQLKWLRKQMGLVSQEPALFNDTVQANIAYGKEGNATDAEIIVAAELADAHSFISGMPEGYQTMVGERGVQLSGGQKQRIAIARAIIKSPKILLLDEATSALDAESERVVQDALDRVMVNRTTIVVAHRLSTIKNADQIAVVKDGTIAEMEKHDILINRGGLYASLVSFHANARVV